MESKRGFFTPLKKLSSPSIRKGEKEDRVTPKGRMK
jgi:hypothetical protein